MLTWFVLVPKRTSTRMNVCLIIRLLCLAQQTLKLTRIATCLYMPISRRQCILLCVSLDFHGDSLWSHSVFYSDLVYSPVHLFLQIPMMNFSVVHVQVIRIVFDPLFFRCPEIMPTIWLALFVFYLAEVIETLVFSVDISESPWRVWNASNNVRLVHYLFTF